MSASGLQKIDPDDTSPTQQISQSWIFLSLQHAGVGRPNIGTGWL